MTEHAGAEEESSVVVGALKCQDTAFQFVYCCLDYVWVKKNTNKGIITIMKFIEAHYRFTG